MATHCLGHGSFLRLGNPCGVEGLRAVASYPARVRSARCRPLDVGGDSEQVSASTDAADGVRSSASAELLVLTWPSTRTGPRPAAVDLPPKKWTGLGRQSLEVRWTEITQSRVEAAGIIEALDVLEQVAPGIGASGINPVMDPLGLERVKEALHRRVVETIAFAAHSGCKSNPPARPSWRRYSIPSAFKLRSLLR
jgi:hypothetical protein